MSDDRGDEGKRRDEGLALVLLAEVVLDDYTLDLWIDYYLLIPSPKSSHAYFMRQVQYKNSNHIRIG